MTHRSPKLLKQARDASCIACEAEDGTIVACHANEGTLGKGAALKAHDCMTAELCARCHDWADGRDGREMDPRGLFTDRREFMRLMILKTTIRRFETGQVRVR